MVAAGSQPVEGRVGGLASRPAGAGPSSLELILWINAGIWAQVFGMSPEGTDGLSFPFLGTPRMGNGVQVRWRSRVETRWV